MMIFRIDASWFKLCCLRRRREGLRVGSFLFPGVRSSSPPCPGGPGVEGTQPGLWLAPGGHSPSRQPPQQGPPRRQTPQGIQGHGPVQEPLLQDCQTTILSGQYP